MCSGNYDGACLLECVGFLLSSIMIQVYFSILVILYSKSLPLQLHCWHGALGLYVTNGLYSPSFKCGNLVAKVFFEIGVARRSKFFAPLWWYILESNEGNHISFDLFFPDATETVDVFLNFWYFLFLNIIRWINRDSSNWRWLISFSTQYILFLLAQQNISLYVIYTFVAAPTNPQINIYHHYFLLLIQLYGIYFMQIWSATSTDHIPILYIWMTLRRWNVISTVLFSILLYTLLFMGVKLTLSAIF